MRIQHAQDCPQHPAALDMLRDAVEDFDWTMAPSCNCEPYQLDDGTTARHRLLILADDLSCRSWTARQSQHLDSLEPDILIGSVTRAPLSSPWLATRAAGLLTLPSYTAADFEEADSIASAVFLIVTDPDRIPLTHLLRLTSRNPARPLILSMVGDGSLRVAALPRAK